MSKTIAFCLATVLVLGLSVCLDNGLGRTPPMGFNTWNHFDCDINETVMRQAADSIVRLGLREAGYIYVNIDDCWMTAERSPAGELVPDPTRFPHGIRVLADYVHQLGLKLGIYSSAGKLTCQRLPASLDYEDIDARAWARWGIDYVKYDNCFHDERAAKERYRRMRDALNKTGRPMFFSICNWGEERLYEIGSELGNSWRTTYDIENTFDSMRSIFRQNAFLAKHAGVGAWNDPDMLEVGNGVFTVPESRTHFGLWAMAKSPLLLGCDLTKISPEDFNIISNKEVIAIDQDPKGKQAVCVTNCESSDFTGSSRGAQIFVAELAQGDFAVSVTNWNNDSAFTDVKVNFKELGLSASSYRVRDLWKKADVGVIKDGFTVPRIESHDTAMFRLIHLQ